LLPAKFRFALTRFLVCPTGIGNEIASASAFPNKFGNERKNAACLAKAEVHALHMSVPEASRRTVSGDKGRKPWVALASLIVFCALNIFVLLVLLPKFEAIYAEALAGQKLPGTTNFIITWRIGLIGLALAWPIGCIIFRKWPSRYSILWENIGIILLLLQGAFTIFALMIPMMGGIAIGMSDAGK
jgi:hypothetical protein